MTRCGFFGSFKPAPLGPRRSELEAEIGRIFTRDQLTQALHHREQVQEALDEAADTVLRSAKAAGPKW